jgi:acetyl-CoA acetyltransferase
MRVKQSRVGWRACRSVDCNTKASRRYRKLYEIALVIMAAHRAAYASARDNRRIRDIIAASDKGMYGMESGVRLRNRCAIVGVGNSALGRVPGMDSLALLEQASWRTVADAGLSISDIDGLVSHGPGDIYSHHQRIGERLGINARFSTSVDNGGASQVLAVALAVMAIDAGLCSTVLCGYGRNGWSRTNANSTAKTSLSLIPQEHLPHEFGPEYGYFGAVASHGLGAQRHMHEYGTKREHFAHVAISFREHALRNPEASMKKPLTLEDYFAARMIAEPYGVFDCSLISDGAGAVIVTSAERARDLKAKPVYIRGFGSFNNLRGWTKDRNMVETATKQSGEAAYRMAGIGPRDIDTAQLYDCFTGMVVTQFEDYGFCAKGEGGPFAASGALRLEGALPTNTSGGQLSEAHVEGMLQIVEGVRQLRHTHPKDRQVADASIALVSGHGGNAVCHSTLILGAQT